MRFLLAILLLSFVVSSHADGFTTYGVSSFNSIREANQVALIRLEPRRVTLDMYIAIDGIPNGETVTFVLPFWQKPDGFTLEAMSGEDFSRQYINSLRPQFRQEIRRANRTAVETLPTAYCIAGLCTYWPVGLALIPGSILFPVFGKKGYDRLEPYLSTEIAAGSADLYQVSTNHDLQQLVAKAGLPSKFAGVLRKYHTQYYAVMRLRGQEKTTESVFDTTGIHYHFTHAGAGKRYTYTYPLGTGGAWAKPIGLTKIYATCPGGYRLKVSAPVEGKMTDYRWMESLVYDQTKKKDADHPETASVLPPVRYPTAWHRAYFNCNPTKDIAICLSPRPFDPLFLFASWLRDAELPAVPFILIGLLLAHLLTGRFYLSRALSSAGQAESYLHFRDYYLRIVKPILCIWLGGAIIGIWWGEILPIFSPAVVILILAPYFAWRETIKDRLIVFQHDEEPEGSPLLYLIFYYLIYLLLIAWWSEMGWISLYRMGASEPFGTVLEVIAIVCLVLAPSFFWFYSINKWGSNFRENEQQEEYRGFITFGNLLFFILLPVWMGVLVTTKWWGAPEPYGTLLSIIAIVSLVLVPFFIWYFTLHKWGDHLTENVSQKLYGQSILLCYLVYFLLLPVWLGVAWVLDWVVRV